MFGYVRTGILAAAVVFCGCSAGPRGRVALPGARREADPDALLHFVAAKMYGLKGDHHAAIIELQEAAAIDSTSPAIFFTMAQSYAYLSKVNSAIKAAQDALHLDNRLLGAHHFLASLYERKGDTESAARSMERIVALSPDDIEAHFALVDAYVALDRKEAAVSALEALETLNPLPPRAQIRAAAFYGALGENEGAVRLYREGLKGDPHNVLAWLGMGMILEAEGEREEALETYERSVESNPDAMDLYLRLARLYDTQEEALNSDDPQFLLLLAEALVERDRRDWAVSALEKAVSVGRDDPDVWIDVAYTYSVNLDSLQRAQVLLERALESFPESGDVYLALGEVYEQQEHWDQAKASFRKAVSFDAENTEYLFGLASCLERHGEFDGSVATFERLLEIDPYDALALNYVGYMLADKGIRLQEALSLIGQALEIQPENGAFLDSMGWVLYRLGRYAEAEEYLDRAVQFEPAMEDEENAIIFDHVGDVAEALGNFDKAVEYWDKSLERDGTNERVRQKLERLKGGLQEEAE